jgi:hypothetical protein
MQITVGIIQTHRRPARGGSRVVSLVTGIALIAVAVGTAAAAVRAAPGPGFDHRGPALVASGGTVPLSMPEGAPGDTTSSYTTIEYEGEGPATVRLFAEITGTRLAPHLDVLIERGSGERATWTPDPGGPIFEGPLAGLPTDWGRGIAAGRVWSTGESHTYRITVTLLDHEAAEGHTAEATFRWEARAA